MVLSSSQAVTIEAILRHPNLGTDFFQIFLSAIPSNSGNSLLHSSTIWENSIRQSRELVNLFLAAIMGCGQGETIYRQMKGTPERPKTFSGESDLCRDPSRFPSSALEPDPESSESFFISQDRKIVEQN